MEAGARRVLSSPAPAAPAHDAATLSRWANAVLRVTDAALGHLGVDELLDELLDRVTAEIDVDVAGVLLLDEQDDALVVRAGKGLDAEVADRVRVAVGDGFAGRVAAERRPVVLCTPCREELCSSHLADKGLVALLGVPLVVAGRVTGVLHVGSRRPRRFGADEVALLELVADRAARAIEHAALFEREHHIAETLQRSLLPRTLPEVRGVEACARYVPGGRGSSVGGDWYDVIPLPGGRVGLAIGDVAGHGTRAAGLMGLARNALRAYALEGHGPARVLELLDRLLDSTEPGELVTVAYLVVDPAGGTVSLANAGHPPPLVESGGASEFLDGARSVPLGVAPEEPRQEAVSRVGPGTTIVLYTDGLVERRGAALDDGMARLQSAVETAPEGLDGLCDHVLGAMVKAEGLADDAAVLGIRCSPACSGTTRARTEAGASR